MTWRRRRNQEASIRRNRNWVEYPIDAARERAFPPRRLAAAAVGPVTDVPYVRSFQQEERLLTAAKQKEEDKFMNEQTKSDSKPDDLTKASEPRSTDLTPEELEQVSGGKEVAPPGVPCCT
jgi:hypothetical protein